MLAEEEPLLLNELAQWAALLVIGVFVFGLLRQLGDFLVPPRERAARARGPSLGAALPAGLLSEEERSRLLELLRDRSAGWAAVLVVDEECPRCEELLENLERTGAPEGAPVVALSNKSGPAHRARLEEVADLVAVDATRLERAALDVRPFTLILDGSLKVVDKQVAWDLQEAVEMWRRNGNARQRGVAPPPWRRTVCRRSST